MILLLILLLCLANNTHMEAKNVKTEIVINGEKIVCDVCGKHATNILTCNGKIYAYCDRHISKEEIDQLEADLKEFEDDCKKCCKKNEPGLEDLKAYIKKEANEPKC